MTEVGDELLRQQLDLEQLEVAARTGRNILVLAPPGSGKTRVLVNAAAHRVRHARELVGYDNARILCLTFGNDAAREMQQRLERRPLSVRRQRMWVGNYHGLGMHLLRRYGHLVGWPRDAGLIPSPQNETIVAEVIRDLGVKGVSPRAGATAISRLKGRRSVDEAAAETLIRLRSRYDEILAERRLRDFDDLILHSLGLLEQVPTVRNVIHDAYPFLFVDELQDTNLLQLDLLSQLVGDSTRVFAVADDDQMIYGWRDAHPGNISEFVNRFDVEEIALRGNYRCPKNIVAAANEVIAVNDRRRDVLMESRVEDRDGEVVVITASTVTEAEAVARAIETAVTEGVALGQLAVLAPHKFKFDEVLSVLDHRGIRYVHPGGDQLTGRPIVGILRLALRCVAGGIISATDVATLGLDKDPADAANTIQTRASRAHEGTPRGLLTRLLTAFDWGTIRDPKHDPNAVRILARMFRKALDDEHPASAPDLASAIVLHWDRLEAAALRAEEAVKIMTSFAAKGMEYQVVILPFMNDGIVPYQFKNAPIDWQEARRVFYVALTRAEHRVVLIRDSGRASSELLAIVEPHANVRETI